MSFEVFVYSFPLVFALTWELEDFASLDPTSNVHILFLCLIAYVEDSFECDLNIISKLI